MHRRTALQSVSRKVVALGIGIALLAAAVAGTAFNQSPAIGDEQAADASAVYYESYADINCLAGAHAQAEIACIDCHDDLSAALEGAPAKGDESTYEFSTNKCLTCHNDNDPATGQDWESIRAATVLEGTVTTYNKTGTYNVHKNHRSMQDCTDCHVSHGTSVLSCTFCHELDNVPENWEITFDYRG